MTKPRAMPLLMLVLPVLLGATSIKAQTCSSSDFPTNLTGSQVSGLAHCCDTPDATSCMQKCCDQGAGCEVYQWSYKQGSHDFGQCWLGKFQPGASPGAYISFGRKSVPAPTPPPPAPQSPYAIDDTPGLAMRWEGVGAISGGGATSKLLMDYPQDTVADILDFMFKPNFGLDLDILKVEMGGDTDSTEGAEPSHMHGGFGDANYNRGYEWWLMREAKARKPNLKLYGLPWGWPGWLDPSATPDKQASNAFANPNITANYTLSWLLGAKHVHNLTIDYMGQWNERNAPDAYAEALRAAVNGSELAGVTTVLNRLPHYPGTSDKMPDGGCTNQEWNTTDGRYWVDEEGSIYDGRSARCLARCINRNYVTGCHTATFQWHLISSFYDYLPWSRCGLAVANEPWSGHYEITSPLWAVAHTTQFADPGWRYTQHNAGVTLLGNGGSLVTRIAPDKSQFSIVIEKMTTANSDCARGSNPTMNVETESVKLIFKGNLLKLAQQHGLQVWYSNLSSANNEGVNPQDNQVFQKLAPLKLQLDGSVTLDVNAEEIYTLTTLTIGQKGTVAKPPPTNVPFPIPFAQPFDNESISSPPAYWYDQMGAWEVQADPENGGNLMRQVSPVWPACWGYSCSGPLTYFGPQDFNTTGNLTIKVDVKLEDHGTWSLNAASKGIQAGVALATNGTFTQHFGKDKTTGSVQFAVNEWHTVQLAFVDNSQGSQTLTVKVDGTVLGTTNSGAIDGWYIEMGLDRYIFASVDNFMIM